MHLFEGNYKLLFVINRCRFNLSKYLFGVKYSLKGFAYLTQKLLDTTKISNIIWNIHISFDLKQVKNTVMCTNPLSNIMIFLREA